jgi:hypothetical protein
MFLLFAYATQEQMLVRFCVVVFFLCCPLAAQDIIDRKLSQAIIMTFAHITSKDCLIISVETNEVLINRGFTTPINEDKYFHYTNKHGISFGCYLSDDAKTVVLKIKNWLDQFFVFNSLEKGCFICEIPVLYSAKLSTCEVFMPFQSKILCSERYLREVRITKRYRTIIGAPIYSSDFVAEIAIQSPVFEFPYVCKVPVGVAIPKAGHWKTFLDSCSYLLFGKSWSEYEKHKKNE